MQIPFAVQAKETNEDIPASRAGRYACLGAGAGLLRRRRPAGLFVGTRSERQHAVAPLALGEGHRPVSLVDELLHERAVVRERRDAHADGEPAVAAAQVRAGPTGADAFGDLERPGWGRVHEDHREFLAAVARREVALAD